MLKRLEGSEKASRSRAAAGREESSSDNQTWTQGQGDLDSECSARTRIVMRLDLATFVMLDSRSHGSLVAVFRSLVPTFFRDALSGHSLVIIARQPNSGWRRPESLDFHLEPVEHSNFERDN